MNLLKIEFLREFAKKHLRIAKNFLRIEGKIAFHSNKLMIRIIRLRSTD